MELLVGLMMTEIAELAKLNILNTINLKLPLWMANLRENFQHVIQDQDLSVLAGSEKDHPAIIVATGPSLIKNHSLEIIKQNTVKLLHHDVRLIACDSSLSKIENAGLLPHYLASIDGDEKIAEFFSGAPTHPSALINMIFCVNGTHPRTYRAARQKIPGGRPYWFISPIDNALSKQEFATRALHYLTGKMIMPSLGNVGGFCVNLAAVLGCNPIVLVGMDMGYYAIEESPYLGLLKETAKRNKEKIEDYFFRIDNPLGQTVYLDQIFAGYRDQLLDLIQQNIKAKIINCTQGGSLFGDRVEWRSLEDWIRSL